jgi:putative transposase
MGGEVMPWQETDPVLERHHFAQDIDSGQWTMTELCLRYGISRNTGYKWLDRYRQNGPRGLHDHGRAPRSCPHQTPADIVALILEEHTRFGWGARKILKRLRTRDPKRAWPARSTIFDILARHDRVQPRRRRRQWKHPGAAPFNTTAPNQVWTIDFKGQFRTRNGIYCYPLTIIDHFSRYLLGCHGLLDVGGAGVKPHLRHLFRTCGLPDAIRSDNGAPFASTGIHGLNRLNVWWLQLGITHQRITPGSPQENGAHERLHKTLKARATRPAAANLNTQQRAFNAFRHTYNEIRPHEALDDETPASRWAPAPRVYPERIAPPEYPGHFEVRRVSSAGTFRLHAGQHFLSQALNDDYIGLEEVEDGLWNIVYYETLLGRFDEHTHTITGAPSLKGKC